MAFGLRQRQREPAAVLVVAEIGANHDGGVERAILWAAAEAGEDAVKLRLLSADVRLAEYPNDSGEGLAHAMVYV